MKKVFARGDFICGAGFCSGARSGKKGHADERPDADEGRHAHEG